MAMAPALRQTQHLAVAVGVVTLVMAVMVAAAGVAAAASVKAAPTGARSSGERPICQLCGNDGHTVIKCYKRFDHSFTDASEQKSASSASYGIDTNWYMDSDATDNITGYLEKLTVRDEYSGNDQIHTASGGGMKIHQIVKVLLINLITIFF
jgi:hypothetical protein